MQVKAVGFFWYKKDQYDEFMSLCDDRHKLPDTYASFLEKAEIGLQQAKRQGLVAVKVEADIHEFITWCKARGHNVDADARVEFANERVIELIQSGRIEV